MKKIPMLMDATDPRGYRAQKVDGKVVYICPKCKKYTTDISEVFHGSCHLSETKK
jgi:hypothetical protein